ncbi:sensor histidine kinase [Actinomadura scrupuli]|uniref:sensor histidine kinase n=1 Tax=Actinomadura scrupuli TaxID=559629 RepID=UPI003D97A9F0
MILSELSSRGPVGAYWAIPAVLLIAVAASRKIIDHALRPVGLIRAELAAINATDLSTRLPQPPGNDEIALLIRTVNTTLERLDTAQARMKAALERQRQFAADASHELRSPLAGLRLELEEAQLHPGDVDLPALLDHALGDLDRVQEIVTDLLLLTRLGSSTEDATAQVNLTELVQAQVARRADRHAVRLRLEPEVTVTAVPGQMARVLTNLLDNAQHHATRHVQIDLRRSNGHAELVVSDDGDGVAPADRERIFQRFVRLDAARSRDRGGSGLGLAIARDIASAHQGGLHVEDGPGGGARFVLHVPLPSSSPRRRADA